MPMAGFSPSQSFMQPQAPPHYGYQGVVQVVPPMLAEEGAATLLIRHLPEAIPHDTLSRLFSHYGASSVRPCTSGRLRNCAFVDFINEESSLQALRQLNGLRFLGKVLSVERASKPTKDNDNQKIEHQLRKDSTSSMKDPSDGKSLGAGTKLGSSHGSEPIAERLGVDYPFPPHLEYAYPPPDGNILTNIVNALIAVPRFYTQVLHLMNKMNIPAPFRMALPTPPLPPPVPYNPPPPPPPIASNSDFSYLSSGESEMESSEEEVGKPKFGASRVSKPKRKRIKKETIVGPAVNKDVAHEAVGLKPAALIPKEIPIIKKNNSVLHIKITPRQIQNEQKDQGTSKELEGLVENNLNPEVYASFDELKKGKLPPEEILSLPMFKNYTAGNPTNVLYIKNLAKDVVSDDFYFIFGAFFDSITEAKSNMSVKLMQEGRMRGQAFLTFPSIELAHHALKLVNGYVHKGKPMIIQFGRTASATK